MEAVINVVNFNINSSHLTSLLIFSVCDASGQLEIEIIATNVLKKSYLDTNVSIIVLFGFETNRTNSMKYGLSSMHYGNDSTLCTKHSVNVVWGGIFPPNHVWREYPLIIQQCVTQSIRGRKESSNYGGEITIIVYSITRFRLPFVTQEWELDIILM